MIIRSQNKKELHNLDRISMIKIVSDSQRFFVEVNSRYVIGTYSTEEKAIKVLDMIEKQYLDYCCNYHSQSGVFQMPQDNEVNV